MDNNPVALNDVLGLSAQGNNNKQNDINSKIGKALGLEVNNEKNNKTGALGLTGGDEWDVDGGVLDELVVEAAKTGASRGPKGGLLAQLKRFIGGYKDGDGGGFWTSVGKFFRSAERWINSFKGSRSRVTRNDPFVVITADQDKKDQNPYGTGHLNHVSQRDVEKEDEMSGKWFECFDMLMTVNAANETRKDILEGTSDFKKKMSNKEVLTTMGKKVAWPFLKLAKDQYVESKLQEAIQSTMSNDHVVLPKGTHVALTEELAYNQLFGNTPGGFRIYKIIGIDSIKFSDFGSRDDTMLVNSILKINSSRFKFIDQRK